eukprot:964713-Amphidinium_carterae.1
MPDASMICNAAIRMDCAFKPDRRHHCRCNRSVDGAPALLTPEDTRGSTAHGRISICVREL